VRFFWCGDQIIADSYKKMQISSHIFRSQVYFTGLSLRIQPRKSLYRSLIQVKDFSSDNNVDEKPVFLVGQHDIAIIQENLDNDKERIRDQSIQYKLRDKVFVFQ
jgi:hypothetical protein